MSCDTPLITSPAGPQIAERQKSQRPEQFRPPLGMRGRPPKLSRVDVVPQLYTIVILEGNNGELLGPLVCGTGKKHDDPIILDLKDEHVQLVLRQDGIELPRDWVQAKSSGEPIKNKS